MIFNFKEYSNLSILGVINNDYDFLKSQLSSKQDTIFFLAGDLYLNFKSDDIALSTLSQFEYILSLNNNVLCILRGNNDNPVFFKEYSKLSKILLEECPHIFLCPDYSIIKMKDHTILCIGGARSLNRSKKIYNNWNNEMVKVPSANFYEKYNNENIDIIISHAAPLFAFPNEFSKKSKNYISYIIKAFSLYDKTLKEDLYKERLLLKGIYEKLNIKNKIKYWVYSHYKKDNLENYNETTFISLNEKEVKEIS